MKILWILGAHYGNRTSSTSMIMDTLIKWIHAANEENNVKVLSNDWISRYHIVGIGIGPIFIVDYLVSQDFHSQPTVN